MPDAFEYAVNCHCSNCRRTTGSAFKPFAGIAHDKLSISAGSDHLMIHGGEAAHDAHCRRCGSLLYSVVRDGAFVHVAMGTLVDDPSIRSTAHIFLGSKFLGSKFLGSKAPDFKAPWFSFSDDFAAV